MRYCRSYLRYGTRWRRHPAHGFLAIWQGVAIVFVVVSLFGGIQTYRLKGEQSAFAEYRERVRVEGEAAKRIAEAAVLRDREAKESADAQINRLRSANAALNRGLLDARSTRGYVPPSPAGSRDTDTACFGRAELERALRELDAGVSGLIGEGDEARSALSVVRDWAKAR